MHNEAVQLRRVVEDQSQQVAALKMHAERMAVEAQKAQERVSEGWSKGGGSGLRVKGSIRGGGERAAVRVASRAVEVQKA